MILQCLIFTDSLESLLTLEKTSKTICEIERSVMLSEETWSGFGGKDVRLLILIPENILLELICIQIKKLI